MDWFTSLESPTQVAIVGVLAGLVSAMAAVGVSIVNNRKAGGGKAEIAALTIDASSIKMVAAAMEALNVTLLAQNGVGTEIVLTVEGMTKEIEELRREVRALSDKMRGRG